MHLYIVPYLQQNIQEEIYPGATPFSRSKGFWVFSSKHRCVQPPHLKSFQKQQCKCLKETLLDGVVIESAIVVVVFPFCSHDHLTGSKVFLVLFYKDREIYFNFFFQLRTFK